MKSNEAPGVDTVPIEMWREFSTKSEGSEILRKLFSLNKERGSIPETMADSCSMSYL
jgi:hypothetical protein